MEKKITLDGRTLGALRDLYVPGAEVEAVFVAGVEAGARGNVKEVHQNGNISVIWKNGMEFEVQYPAETIRVVYKDTECMLKKKRGTKDGYCFDDCKYCGWNPQVSKQRKQNIRDGGLIKDENGLRHLVVHKGYDL